MPSPGTSWTTLTATQPTYRVSSGTSSTPTTRSVAGSSTAGTAPCSTRVPGTVPRRRRCRSWAELAGSTGPRRGAVVVLLVHLLAGFPEEYTPAGFDPDRVAEERGDDDALLPALVAAFEATVAVLRRLLAGGDPWVRGAAGVAPALPPGGRAPRAAG